ncbi:MAG: dUTP diphosphatase [Spirochaetaceae bacterium]|nr:dUTP diphosphatase [Spirochaetaceae bacterium]
MDKIKIYCDYEAGREPRYGSKLASGADIKANLIKDVIIRPGESELIPTGLRLHIPEGYEGQVRPRSGLALNYSITVLNTPGTIDSDYRGELKIILINHGRQDFIIQDNDRIAQIVFTPVVQAEFVQSKDLTASERGRNGFGSTGT